MFFNELLKTRTGDEFRMNLSCTNDYMIFHVTPVTVANVTNCDWLNQLGLG